MLSWDAIGMLHPCSCTLRYIHSIFIVYAIAVFTELYSPGLSSASLNILSCHLLYTPLCIVYCRVLCRLAQC